MFSHLPHLVHWIELARFLPWCSCFAKVWTQYSNSVAYQNNCTLGLGPVTGKRTLVLFVCGWFLVYFLERFHILFCCYQCISILPLTIRIVLIHFALSFFFFWHKPLHSKCWWLASPRKLENERLIRGSEASEAA